MVMPPAHTFFLPGDTQDAPNPLREQLTYKGAKFVTCPGCRHGGTTVIAKEWLSRRRYAASMAVVIVFTPLTLGVMLFLIPLLLRPESVVHSCLRCGLRLAVATSGTDEFGYTVPVDVHDHHFVPAPDDWRPHLARLPGGMRVARSPLGAPPEILEREMKVSDTRFAERRAIRRLRLRADETTGDIVRCTLDDDGDAEVLYEIHASGVRSLRSSGASIKVNMRSPPAEDAVTEGLPSYSKQPTDDITTPAHEPSASSRFTQACRFQLFSQTKRKYSIVMYIPNTSSNTGETAYLNPVHARHRSFFWAAKPIWRWYSSQGALLWISRRYRDAEMTALQTRLCLVDDYEQLIAVLDGWDGLSLLCAAEGANTNGRRLKSTLTLYADLDAQVLGEVLGSLCALAVQVKRVTTELKAEAEERRRNAT